MDLGINSQMGPDILYHTARDGYPFASRVWRRAEASARVIVIHGIVSHSGWYLRSCQYLAERGLEVHAIDRRGSGLNLQQRGDVAHLEQWFTDFDDYMQGLAGNRPTVLLGISWGGKLAAALASRQSIQRLPDSSRIAGVGLICPGIYAYQQVSRTKQILLKLAANLGMTERRVTIPLTDPALFTGNPFYQSYIRDDPFMLRKVTIRFAIEDLRLNHLARSAASQIRIPAFLISAGKERIVDNPRTCSFWDQIVFAPRRHLHYPNAAHTLEFEADPNRYLEDLYSCVRELINSDR